MRGGHKSRGSQQGLNTLAKGQSVLELIEQSKLIDQHSTQDIQSDTLKALDRGLTTPFEHVFEQGIEWLNGFGTQLMEDTPDVNAGVCVRVMTASAWD